MATLTADGCVDTVGVLSFDDCCPLPIGQVDACAMACSFVNLLPTGPMWDGPKARMLDFYRSNTGMNPCEMACPPPELECQTLPAYAVYLSKILLDLLHNALWPSLRESNPSTAVTSLDDWLDRLGWQDCFRTQCRSVLLGDLTPYEIMGECGPVFCPVDTPPALECAVKSGIVQALTRANMGGIKNLCWLNWVIEPLGAEITPRDVEPCGPNYPGKPCMPCGGTKFTICQTSDTLPACQTDTSPVGQFNDPGRVQAYIDRPCNAPAGLPETIWPGVLAAECLVRSLLPKTCPNVIERCTGCAVSNEIFELVALDGDGLLHPFAVDTPTTGTLIAVL